MELSLGMALHLPVDGDVAGVADLLGQIGRVEDELRPEVSVLLHLRQKAQIDADAVILQDLIDEAGVAGLVAAHEAEQFLDILVLDPLLDLRIEHAAGEFGGERADQEILELLAQLGRQRFQIVLEFVGLDEMRLVVIGAQFPDDRIPFGAHQADIEAIHRLEIGGIEARAEDCVLARLVEAFGAALDAGRVCRLPWVPPSMGIMLPSHPRS